MEVSESISITSKQSEFDQCTASKSGAGIWAEKVEDISLKQTKFTKCIATSGQAAYLSGIDRKILVDCTLFHQSPYDKLGLTYINRFSGSAFECLQFSNFSHNIIQKFSIVYTGLTVSSLYQFNTVANNYISPIYDLQFVAHYISKDIVVENNESDVDYGITHADNEATGIVNDTIFMKNRYKRLTNRNPCDYFGCILYDNEISILTESNLIITDIEPSTFNYRKENGYCDIWGSMEFSSGKKKRVKEFLSIIIVNS